MKTAVTKRVPAINPRFKQINHIINNVPEELLLLPQWVLWSLELRGGKTTKIPYSTNGSKASSTDSTTWSDFQSVMAAYIQSTSYSGIGFVFTENDPYVGIDLDKCRDPATGVVDPWAQEILDAVHTYAELSPSGTGFHLIGRGKLPSNGRRKDRIEMYDSDRYFTVTGDRHNKLDVEDIQPALDSIHERVFGKVKAPGPGRTKAANESTLVVLSAQPGTSDAIEKIIASRDAGTFNALSTGQWAALGHPSQSEADLAFVGLLARHLGPYPESIDAVFRQSALFRDKWDELRGDMTYGQKTIAKALEQVQAMSPQSDFMAKMNERFAVIQVGSNVKILDIGESGNELRLLSSPDFALLTSNFPSPDPKVSAAAAWAKSQLRREFGGLVFSPGKDVPGQYNLWRGFSVKPEPGNCALFWQLVLGGICGGSDVLYEYVRHYFAHMVQRPWERPEIAIVLRGEQGTGKNTFVEAMGSMLRQHFSEVTSMDQLTGRFNGHMRNVLLLHANEATWGGDKRDSGKLKALITDPAIPIELKGADIFHVPNYLRLVISSNNSWPVPVEADDRRFLILNVCSAFKQNTAFFAALHAQLNDGGREALMYDLMNLDISGFSPRDKPASPHGADMKIRSADGPTQWLFDCLSGNAWSDRNLGMFDQTGASVTCYKSAFFDDYQHWSKANQDRHPVTRDQFFKRVRHLLGSSMVESRPAATPGKAAVPPTATRPSQPAVPAAVRERIITLISAQGCRQAFEVAAGIAPYAWEPI